MSLTFIIKVLDLVILRKGTSLPLDFLGDLRRTHMCGELRPEHTGSQVVLLGWVNRRRDLGNVIFIDIRDRSGMTQLVFDKSENAAVHEKASALRSEYVIAAIGKVRRRDADHHQPEHCHGRN